MEATWMRINLPSRCALSRLPEFSGLNEGCMSIGEVQRIEQAERAEQLLDTCDRRGQELRGEAGTETV
jgi:hypothetical protein